MSAIVQGTIATPSLPNFVKATIPGVAEPVTIDVADLDSEQIAMIGEQWTRALAVHAKQRRDNQERATAESLRSRVSA